MAARDEIPPSLVEHMNHSAGVYDQWRREEGGFFARQLATDAVYDKQKAQFVARPDGRYESIYIRLGAAIACPSPVSPHVF